jgi:hypothetical protein
LEGGAGGREANKKDIPQLTWLQSAPQVPQGEQTP